MKGKTTQVLITPRSFGSTDPAVFNMLEDAGFSIACNDTGKVFDKATMIKKLADCEGVILGVDPMDADVIGAAPKLKAISRYGVGLDNVDLEAAARHGIRVSHAAGANSEAVADYAFALMLAVARRVPFIDRNCRAGKWIKLVSVDVNHAKLGILGLGAIGRQVAKRARGFDMDVIAYDLIWDEAFAQANGVKRALPEEIYRTCDFISMHLPLTNETKNFIGAAQIAMMKPNAILINTARGGLIDEEALLVALRDGRIYGAGIDTFSQEPPDDAWYGLDNVVIGSHCSSSTICAERNMSWAAARNLIKDLRGGEIGARR